MSCCEVVDRVARDRVLRVRVASAILAASLFLMGSDAAQAAPITSGRATYQIPLAGAAVLRAFDAPAGPYAAGHRGVDLAAAPNRAVRAAAAGEVSFAGMVAGRGVVVVAHPDGIRTTYEPIVPAVAEGQRVDRGETVGRVSGVHGDFPEDSALHWGARRGDAYLDPMTLLQPLGPVRLVPV